MSGPIHTYYKKRRITQISSRGLNNQFEKTSWPLPDISDIIDSLNRNMFFFEIDLASVFFRMALDEDSQNLTAFMTPMGLLKGKILSKGLASAPGAFETLLELSLSGLSYDIALVYLDDIVIFCRSCREPLERMEFNLGRLKEAELKIKGSK